MAEQSLREQIIEYVVGEVEELDCFNRVKRELPAYAELGTYPHDVFPVAAIVAGLPQVVEAHVSRRACVDVFRSNLEIVVFVWDHLNEDCDTRISFLADELWAKLYSDQTKGGLAIGTTLAFGEIPTYLRPYINFSLTATVNYKHTTGGI